MATLFVLNLVIHPLLNPGHVRLQCVVFTTADWPAQGENFPTMVAHEWRVETGEANDEPMKSARLLGKRNCQQISSCGCPAPLCKPVPPGSVNVVVSPMVQQGRKRCTPLCQHPQALSPNPLWQPEELLGSSSPA